MKVINCKQYDEIWFSARRGVPTASEFNRIVTAKRWDYATGARSYICDLIAETYFPGLAYGGFESVDMQRGTMMEPEARRYFEFETDSTVNQVGFILTEDSRFGASPDALVGDLAGLELKCPKESTQVRWILDGGIPDEHLAQVHGGMIVAERKEWWFMSYCPPLPVILQKVEWDDRTERLKEYLETFWKDYQAAIAKVKAMDRPLPTRTVDYGELGSVEETIHEPSYW